MVEVVVEVWRGWTYHSRPGAATAGVQLSLKHSYAKPPSGPELCVARWQLASSAAAPYYSVQLRQLMARMIPGAPAAVGQVMLKHSYAKPHYGQEFSVTRWQLAINAAAP